MNVNLIRRKNELTFADLKMGDVFYPVPDYEGDETDLYMVIDTIEHNDYTDNPVELNAVVFKDGTLTYFFPDIIVRRCIATIDAEG